MEVRSSPSRHGRGRKWLEIIHLRARGVPPEQRGEGRSLQTPWSQSPSHRIWGSPQPSPHGQSPPALGFPGRQHGRRRAQRPSRAHRSHRSCSGGGAHGRWAWAAPDPLLPPGATPEGWAVLRNTAPSGSQLPSGPRPDLTGHRLGRSFTSWGGACCLLPSAPTGHTASCPPRQAREANRSDFYPALATKTHLSHSLLFYKG